MLQTELQATDLLFCRQGSSKFSRAIHHSTGEFNHVGIYFEDGIYHASSRDGVVKQSLSDFLKEFPYVSVFRISDLKVDKARLLDKAREHLGKPYNKSFYPDRTGFYCSEFIAEILGFFEEIPMSFSDGKIPISIFWQTYYEDLQLPVPLGIMGTNPTQLSVSKKLTYIGDLDDSDLQP